jgi:F0F1-type ATP synthase membrane subunit b/b'
MDSPRVVDFDVDAAMARVLQAERDARAAVAQAQQEAMNIAEAARAEARAVAERRRERLARVHARVEQQLQSALAAIGAEAQALPVRDDPDAAARERLERAVDALAQALTTPGGRT